MSRRILKFEVPPGASAIGTADEPRFLAAGNQNGKVVVWVEATVGTGVQTGLYAALTGEAPPDDAEYVGTTQLGGVQAWEPPYIVVHVYRQRS